MTNPIADYAVSFIPPKGYKVQHLNQGNYCLSHRSRMITLLVLGEEASHHYVATMQSNMRDPCFEEVKELTFGKNVYVTQRATRAVGASKKYTEISFVISSQSACGFIRIQGPGEIDLVSFTEFLESVSLKAPSLGREAAGEPAQRGAGLVRRPTGVSKPRGRKRRFLVFADHYAFCVWDASHGQVPLRPMFTPAEVKRGWARTTSAVWYVTVGHSNQHRVDIFVKDHYTPDGTAERVLANNLESSGGQIAVLEHESESEVSITPGEYTIYLRGYNLGRDAPEVEDDSLLLSRHDLERYEIIIVPGRVEKEGVIQGRPDLV